VRRGEPGRGGSPVSDTVATREETEEDKEPGLTLTDPLVAESSEKEELEPNEPGCDSGTVSRAAVFPSGSTGS
jgi:hypothetical protein